MIATKAKSKKTSKKKYGPKGPWKWTDERLDELAYDLEIWAEVPGNTLLSKFCSDQGIHPQQLAEFKKKSDRLSLAIKKAKAKECHLLERFCLYEGFTDNAGKYRRVSTTGAIFLLKNNHGYTDGRESASSREEEKQQGEILNYKTKNYATNGN